MARENRTHHTQEARPADAGRRAAFEAISPTHIAAILAIVAAGFLLVWQVAVGDSPRKETPQYLTTALGAPQRTAPLVRKPSRNLRVAIRERGYGVTSRGRSVGLMSVGAPAADWNRYANGVSRATDFGRETITVSG